MVHNDFVNPGSQHLRKFGTQRFGNFGAAGTIAPPERNFFHEEIMFCLGNYVKKFTITSLLDNILATFLKNLFGKPRKESFTTSFIDHILANISSVKDLSGKPRKEFYITSSLDQTFAKEIFPVNICLGNYVKNISLLHSSNTFLLKSQIS